MAAVTIESGVNIEPGVIIGPAIIARPQTPHTVTPSGTAKIQTTNTVFGGGAYTNSGGTGYLTVTPASNMAFGRGEFTVEFWLYNNTATTQSFYGTRPYSTNGPYPSISMSSTGNLIYYVNNAVKINATTPCSAGVWQSVALVRYAGVTKFYLNGVSVGSWTDTTNYLASTCILFGDDYFGGNGYNINGYADEFRISNIARYTGDYTPATTPFVPDQHTLLLLHFNGTNGSTTFTDSMNTLP